MPRRENPQLTDEEIHSLALDAIEGRIFTSLQLRDDLHELRSVFMVLGLMDRSQMLRYLRRSSPYMFYEYLSKAAPLAVNGLPTFFSVKSLNKADTDRFLAEYDRMRKALDYPTS